ncbi:Transmembrane channel-like protein 3 [Nymphon striatum]|nr:Transmembrane channel-like protein 3 [Nymphon striatum]
MIVPLNVQLDLCRCCCLHWQLDALCNHEEPLGRCEGYSSSKSLSMLLWTPRAERSIAYLVFYHRNFVLKCCQFKTTHCNYLCMTYCFLLLFMIFHFPAEGEDDEDYADSVDAIMRRKYSQDKGSGSKKGRRMSRRSSTRRTSSPFLGSDGDSFYRRRRRSGSTTTSGDDTVLSIDEQELTADEISENLRLHKEVISSVKQQPWKMMKKLGMLRRAKTYVQKHEGEIAQSKRSRDVFAKYKILISRFWVKWKRELGNLITSITPWEMRIKKIESHFGSVVASYFIFLRWIFWINFAITAFIVGFIMVPEILGNSEINDTMRKGVEDDEIDDALKLTAIWNFEEQGNKSSDNTHYKATNTYFDRDNSFHSANGYLKFSPIFYGYYSNRNKNSFGYKVPMAYFLTSLCVYVYSFAVILRRMAENSRMSKMAEKDDEYTFTWKLFTGWDYMIGNSETSYNKFASINMGFKEAILDEKEKKKEKKSWQVITLRVLANVCVLILLVSSAYAVVLVVERSQKPDADSSWWRQNEVTVVVSMISTVYPSFFDIIGLMEHYHPRQQLRWQLARILILYLLNLYTLIFALFAKVSDMTDELILLKPNATSHQLTTLLMATNATTIPTPTPTPYTDWSTTTTYLNCSALMIWPNCTNITATLTTEFPQYNFTTLPAIIETITQSSILNATLNGTFGNSTDNPLLNNTIHSLFENVTDLSTETDITNFVSGFITSIFASAFKVKTPKDELKAMSLVMENTDEDFVRDFVRDFTTKPPDFVIHSKLDEVLKQCVLPICNGSTITDEFLSLYERTRTKRAFATETESVKENCEGGDCLSELDPYADALTQSGDAMFDDANSTLFPDTNYTIDMRNCSTNDSDCIISTTEIEEISTVPSLKETAPTAPAYYSHLSEDDKMQLKKLCWETMFGQELVKLTIMDLVLTLITILLTDWFRAFFVRFGNKCCFWDMEKNFPGYGDFKIAENILHMVNNQGMIWMGMFFSPGLPAINTVKLVIMMYARSWAVLTCNIPHETVFRASRSNNFYFALLLVMLFLCTLPVGYAMVWLEPSWHCGPFSEYPKIYKMLTSHITAALPPILNRVLDYMTSPGIVIPMLLLLILAIYYYVSIAASLREANEDLKIQLRRVYKTPLDEVSAMKVENALGLWASGKKKTPKTKTDKFIDPVIDKEQILSEENEGISKEKRFSPVKAAKTTDSISMFYDPTRVTPSVCQRHSERSRVILVKCYTYETFTGHFECSTEDVLKEILSSILGEYNGFFSLWQGIRNRCPSFVCAPGEVDVSSIVALDLKFINMLMKDGDRVLANKLVFQTLANIKRIQVKRYNSAPEDEKKSIERNPYTIFSEAIKNATPILNTEKIERGGTTYMVPIPMRPEKGSFKALKWLTLAGKEKTKNIHFPDRMAQELIDAYNNTGYAVRKKLELHKLCEANKAYGSFRTM